MNIHYYQQKYQKPDFIYQERPQPHPDTGSHIEKSSESPSEKKLEDLKKYLKNTPEIITGDNLHSSERNVAISRLEDQLTLTLSRDPLYSELKTLLDFIKIIEDVHKFIWGIRSNREEAERVIREPGYSSLPHLFTTDRSIARLYARLNDVLNSLPQKAVSLDPIITKYLHQEAVSYIRNNIFNGGLKIALQRDREKTIAITEKAETILKTRRETPEKRIKRLRENPNIFQAGDTTIGEILGILQSLPNKDIDNALYNLIKKLEYLRDNLTGTYDDNLNGRLMALRTHARMLKEGSASHEEIQNGSTFLRETLNLAEKLFGQNSEIRRSILSSQNLLHPSVIKFIQDAPPLQELYKLKQEIDKYLPRN